MADGGTILVHDRDLSESDRRSVCRLRDLGWSCRGIARHLSLPEETVAKVLGVPQTRRAGNGG